MDKIDITIIGAGVIGLACASELSYLGKDVLVVEKNDRFGAETSSRNSEVIHAGLHYPKESLKTRLCIEGKHLIYEYCSKNGITARKTGRYTVAYDDESCEKIEQILKHGRECGIEGLEIISGKEFNLTANETRFGLDIKGGDGVSGKIEVDFSGGNAQNKSYLMLRHAYVKVKNDLGCLLFGQTWDVISPLNLSTLNYAVGWGAGNIGYRRPQIRVSRDFAESLQLDLALARGIGDDLVVSGGSGLTSSDGYDDAVTAKSPQVQGRLGYTIDKLKIGFSGHYGRPRAYNSDISEYRNYNTRSYNVDVYLPVCRFLLKGEAFTGTNLKTYNGSILNDDSFDGVDSSGGWMDATYKLSKSVNFTVGYSEESVDEDTIKTLSRLNNSCLFGNIVYTAKSGVSMGLEVGRWATKYKDLDTAKSVRVQTSFKYSF